MKTTIIAIIFLLIGSAIGGVLALGFGAGMGAASGLMLGSQTGVCLTLEILEERGLVTDPGELDWIVAATVGKLRELSSGVPANAGLEWISDRSGCGDILRQLAQPN